MKILNSYRKKNNKFKRSRRFTQNGGGKKEDLIKQILANAQKIYDSELAVCYGSSWCNAGTNFMLESEKNRLNDEYKSLGFLQKDLDDALAQQSKERTDEERRTYLREQAEKDEKRRLEHIQWLKRQAIQETERLEREYVSSLNAYKTKIQRIPKDDSSLDDERADLELWYDTVIKSCDSDKEKWERTTKLYNEKKKILQPYLDATPSGQRALQQARNRAIEQRALQQARTKAAAEQKALQQARAKAVAEQKALQEASDRAAASQRALQEASDRAVATQKALQEASTNKHELETETFQEKRRREIDALKMDSSVFGKILNSSSTNKSKGKRK